MYGRLSVLLLTLVVAIAAFGKDVYLAGTGKANGFFTDTRIFNPSFDKDITVTARYLPAGNGNNSGAASVPITIPKRTMRLFDDSVQSIFGGGPQLGAIHLQSADDFAATQRIYQDARQAPQAGTLGQAVPGVDLTEAKMKGALLQLKSGTAALGEFRTNWGGVNPNNAVANVTFKLYDKANAVVATKTVAMEPFGVQGPTNIAPFFDNPTADLSDSWISFSADRPVILFGSVVDNGSKDPTYVDAVDDSGIPPAPPAPGQIVANVRAVDFSYDVDFSRRPAEGEEVKFIIRADQGTHGFRLFSPEGQILIDLATVGGTSIERTVTLPSVGTYSFFCTRDLCGVGHTSMNGSFVIGTPTGGPGDGY